MPTDQLVQTSLFDDAPIGQFGTIAFRVVVLPPKSKGDATRTVEVADAAEDEIMPEKGFTPVSSYLEKSSGGRQCCVFLVNGQRQDALDNSFIIQDLGFKYLRNRMVMSVDVDGLTPEAMAKFMQGSRQGFYRGDVWQAIISRIVATLKNDPDLARLEEEAEEKVSELRAGDDKVRNTLDHLIDSHHDFAEHIVGGIGKPGSSSTGEEIGMKTTINGGVVTLLPPEKGKPADYPVLLSQPSSASIRLRPDQQRPITLTSQPANAWGALSELVVDRTDDLPELEIVEERFEDFTRLDLYFREPAEFDSDQYPLHTVLRATARFNGISEPRQLSLRVHVKPDSPPPTIELLDDPTWLRLSSREPVKIVLRESDTHVRLRWNGKDELVRSMKSEWRFIARCLTNGAPPLVMNFSQPTEGRFSLLVSPHPQLEIGQEMEFEVCAYGPDEKKMCLTFGAIVVEPPKDQSKEPRLIDSELPSGSERRPPYRLVYMSRSEYDSDTCWGNTTWTDDDPGCFQEPTERQPLILIINEEMDALRSYREYLTKSYMESEVSRRINKYTSHIAYHLYQMYTIQKGVLTSDVEHRAATDVDESNKQEIHRVAMTLLKLMEVSR